VPPVPNGSSTTERLPDVPTAGAASNTSPFR
jgi:hypothetical protein